MPLRPPGATLVAVPQNPTTAASALPARTDVVVVGAGPTGLALACGLAAAASPLSRLLRNTAMRAAGRLRPVRRVVAMNLSELDTVPDAQRRTSPSRTVDPAAR